MSRWFLRPDYRSPLLKPNRYPVLRQSHRPPEETRLPLPRGVEPRPQVERHNAKKRHSAAFCIKLFKRQNEDPYHNHCNDRVLFCGQFFFQENP